jgi:hypothetical protein
MAIRGTSPYWASTKSACVERRETSSDTQYRPVCGIQQNASTTPRLAKPRKTRESGRRAAFSSSSPRTFIAIVRDGAERRR